MEKIRIVLEKGDSKDLLSGLAWYVDGQPTYSVRIQSTKDGVDWWDVDIIIEPPPES